MSRYCSRARPGHGPRVMTFRRLHPVLVAALATAPLLAHAAADAKPGHPADSVAPMTGDAPAKGLPGYDAEDAGESEAGHNPSAEPGAKKRGKTQTLPTQFGMTLVTPVAGTVEQRIPVEMNRGASGRMSAWSYGGEASVQRVTRDFYAFLNFNYKRTDFEFDGVPVAPWDDLDQYRMTTHIEGDIGGNWRLFADGGVTAALEKNASFGDSLTGRAALGAKYRFSEHFSYYFGVSAVTRLDRSTLVVPLTAFEIRFDRWTIRSLNGMVVSYDFFGDNSLVADGSVTYDNSFFRRTNDATGDGRTVEFQEVPLTFGVTKSLGDHGFIRGYVSTIVWSDYRFATEGRTTGDFQTDPGVIFGLSAGIRF